MITIKFNWPILFSGLILLLIWLARDPGQPRSEPRCKVQRMRPRAGKAAKVMIIDQNQRDASDLDRDAMQAAQAAADGPNPYEAAQQRLTNRRGYRDHAHATV